MGEAALARLEDERAAFAATALVDELTATRERIAHDPFAATLFADEDERDRYLTEHFGDWRELLGLAPDAPATPPTPTGGAAADGGARARRAH